MRHRSLFLFLALSFFLICFSACGDTSSKADQNQIPKPPRRIDDTLDPQSLILPTEAAFNPELPDGIDLHVLSYNIYGTKFATPQEIGAFLRSQNPDVVGLQECPDEARDAIAQAAGFEHVGGSGTVLMTHVPVTDLAIVPLNNGRAYTHATAEFGSVRFSLYVVHLGWNLEGSYQFREFVDDHLANDPLRHVVILGDFNDETYSNQIGIIKEVMADAASAMGWYPGERISWPSFGFDDTEGSQLIDLIFFRKDFPALVLDAEVHNLPKLLSDHKPASAHLRYPKSADAPFAADPLAAHRDIWASFPKTDALPKNLLRNPGAEQGMESWETEGGMCSAAARENQAPHDGAALFTGFEKASDSLQRISLARQTVNLTDFAEAADARRLRLYLSAYMATGYPLLTDGTMSCDKPIPFDDAEIILELLDSDGRTLSRTVSRRRDTLGWHPYVAIVDAPESTRQARFTMMSHHRIQNGDGNDAVFDSLYLGAKNLETPHSLLSADLVENGGAESGDSAGFETESIQVRPDLRPIGLAIFAPWSFSGQHFFYAGGELDLGPGPENEAQLSQNLDLEPYAAHIAKGGVALHWSMALRTYWPFNTIKVFLDLYHRDGELWKRLPMTETFASEWRPYTWLTLLPPGVGSAKIVVTSDVSTTSAALFADEIQARLVEVEL